MVFPCRDGPEISFFSERTSYHSGRLAGEGAIARGLVYQHLLYVILSGLLFARFLLDRGLVFAACLLGGLLLSF